MQKALKLSSSLVVILTMFLVFLPVNAEAPVINIYQVTESGSGNYTDSPSVSGDRIVWTDQRNGNRDIYMYDISSSTETQITNDALDQDWPSISGNIIVWEDYRNGNSDIYMYDLETSTETQITNEASTQTEPRISGNTIVWGDYRNGNSDIYMYNLETSTETQITSDVLDQMKARISGNTIVWEDYRNGNPDIYMYSLETSTETEISTDGAYQRYPNISGDKVVWQDNRNGTQSIYMYDLEASTETQITSNELDARRPAIDSSKIIWEDDRGADGSLYLYDILSTTETRITGDEMLYPSQIAIDGNTIAFTSYGEDYDYSNIFFAEISIGDSTPPTLETLPGDTRVVNLTEDELITTNPYTIRIKPTDDTAIEKVEFYVDDVLICTDTTPDDDGVYSCAWDTSKYHSDIRIVAYDTSGNITEVTRTVTVDPSLYTLPQTGMRFLDYIKYLIDLVF